MPGLMASNDMGFTLGAGDMTILGGLSATPPGVARPTKSAHKSTGEPFDMPSPSLPRADAPQFPESKKETRGGQFDAPYDFHSLPLTASQYDHPLFSSGGPPRPPTDHPLLSGPSRGRGHARAISAAPVLAAQDIHSSGHHRARSSSITPPSSDYPRPTPALQQNRAQKPRGHRRVKSLPSARIPVESGTGSRVGGRSAEVLPTLEELTGKLEERKKQYGEDHSHTGLAHNEIGNYFFRGGKPDLAGRHYRAALHCFESSCTELLEYGSDSSSGPGDSGSEQDKNCHQLNVAVALSNIGAAMWRTGELSQAVKSLEESVAIRRRVQAKQSNFGRDPIPENDRAELSKTLYSLGLARSLRGDYDDALDALDQAQNALSPPAPSEALESVKSELGRIKLALTQTWSRRFPDAVDSTAPKTNDNKAQRDSIKIELARLEDARGKVHLLRGDADSALACHFRALNSKVIVLGDTTHPSVLSSKTNVAAAYRALGKWDDALSSYRDILAAQSLARYGEYNVEARRKLAAEIATTSCAIEEVRREQAKASKRRGGSMGTMSEDFMAAIAEERADAKSPTRGLRSQP